MKKNSNSKKIIVRTSTRRGANSVEYIILVGVVALGALAAFQEFGSKVSSKVSQQGSAVGGIGGQQ